MSNLFPFDVQTEDSPHDPRTGPHHTGLCPYDFIFDLAIRTIHHTCRPCIEIFGGIRREEVLCDEEGNCGGLVETQRSNGRHYRHKRSEITEIESSAMGAKNKVMFIV